MKMILHALQNRQQIHQTIICVICLTLTFAHRFKLILPRIYMTHLHEEVKRTIFVPNTWCRCAGNRFWLKILWSSSPAFWTLPSSGFWLRFSGRCRGQDFFHFEFHLSSDCGHHGCSAGTSTWWTFGVASIPDFSVYSLSFWTRHVSTLPGIVTGHDQCHSHVFVFILCTEKQSAV